MDGLVFWSGAVVHENKLRCCFLAVPLEARAAVYCTHMLFFWKGKGPKWL